MIRHAGPGEFILEGKGVIELKLLRKLIINIYYFLRAYDILESKNNCTHSFKKTV